MHSDIDVNASSRAVDGADVVIRVGWDASRDSTIGTKSTFRLTPWKPQRSAMDGADVQPVVWCPHTWYMSGCWKFIATEPELRISPSVVRGDSTTEQLAIRLASELCRHTQLYGLLALPPREQLSTYLRQPLQSAASRPRLEATVALAIHAAKALPAGDFIETGVFTGGTSIALARVLAGHDPTGMRRLFAADSFEGLPAPTRQDRACTRKLRGGASCIRGEVGSFRAPLKVFRAALAAETASVRRRVVVVRGWFNETLPPAGLRSVAFARLDGDLYASTKVALERLYPLLVPGGVVYIDDYGSFAGCGTAVEEYLTEQRVRPTLHRVHEYPPSSQATAHSAYEAVWFIKP